MVNSSLGMHFELSDDVINSLIFAMENQKENNVFDSEQKEVVELDIGVKKATDRYYSIPEWTSIDGFKVMEHFVTSLHSPLAKEALHEVLFAGKGVFRNFKNTLKDYPEVEQQWFTFKQKVLKEKVVQWYNVFRDSWGLERIEGEPEETENLIFDDFVFREYDKTLDQERMMQAEEMAAQSIESSYKNELGIAAGMIWKSYKDFFEAENKIIYICENIAGDFSGAISVSSVPSPAKCSVVVTLFFILPAWRGLGIGKELFRFCLQELKNRKIHIVIIPEMFIPKTFIKVLLRSGFKKTPMGFTVDLNVTP